MSASARYQDLQTNEAALRSRREVRKCSTFSRTFSRTWSGYGAWYSMGLDPEPDTPVQFRVLLDDSVTLAGPPRSDGRDRSSSSDISDTGSSLIRLLSVPESLSLSVYWVVRVPVIWVGGLGVEGSILIKIIKLGNLSVLRS